MAAAATTVRNLGLALSGDLDVQGGQLVLVRGGLAIAQAVTTAIKMVAGEWYLDESAGVAYFRDILVKTPNLNIIRADFREAITGVLGVLALVKLDLAYDAKARSLTVTWQVTTDVGELAGTVVA